MLAQFHYCSVSANINRSIDCSPFSKCRLLHSTRSRNYEDKCILKIRFSITFDLVKTGLDAVKHLRYLLNCFQMKSVTGRTPA